MREGKIEGVNGGDIWRGRATEGETETEREQAWREREKERGGRRREFGRGRDMEAENRTEQNITLYLDGQVTVQIYK